LSGDAREHRVAEVLRDGTAVTVRAVRPDDRARLRAAFVGLDKESVYTRLFRFKPELTEADLDWLTRVDFDRTVQLVATVGGEDAATVIGSARSVVTDPDDAPATRAEVAFMVEEDCQGRGLASRLLAHLIRLARARGLQFLDAEVLAGNAPMLAVFERSGLPMTRRAEDGVVHVTLALAGAAASEPPAPAPARVASQPRTGSP
jgi:GNAT superfamily N-acetyltransferase